MASPADGRALGFLGLLREEPRTLGFGFLHAFGSSAGQTFFISLLLPGITASLAVTSAEVASLYAVATLASAVVFSRVGRWIDRADLAWYSAGSGAFLALACWLTAAAGGLAGLAAGLIALRLGGQGLMSHVAMTGIARYFRRERGKALALASLGHALGEAILPAAAVTLIAWWGWRSTLGAAGAAVLLLTGAAMLLVRHRPRFRRLDAATAPDEPGHVAHHAATGRGPGLGAWLMVTPAIMATPLFTTALIFHQALIADAKGMPLQWFAFAFVGFAGARIAGSLLGGPGIDRWGARSLLPRHLVPLGVGVAVLALGAGPWSIALYMLLAGLGAGVSGTLVTALVAELVPPARQRRWRRAAAV